MEKKKVYYFACIFAVALAYLALLISFVATKVTEDNKIYVTYVVSDDMVNPKDFEKMQVEEGYILSKPDSIPKASNKFFDGWYMDEGYTVEATFPIEITQSTTIYAKYIDGNVPADNIRYNDRDFTYYITGTIDIPDDTLVIPDAYNDGVHGAKSVGYIVGQDRESIINADSVITTIIVGNSISEICDYFLYNNTRITSVRLGSAVDSISGTAFGGCVNLTDINLGDFAEWRAGDENNPSAGGWYEELELNKDMVITALSVKWQKKSEDVVITYKVGIIPDLSTNWKNNQTEVDAFNNDEGNINCAIDYTNTDNKTTWNGSDFTITQRVKKNDPKLSTFNIYDEINMPYGNNTYFCGWYTYDATTDTYTEVCNGEANTNRTIAISGKATFYAKYLKGTIDPTTLDYANGGFTIARSNVEYINNNSISTVVIPDFYRMTTVSPAYEGLITTIGDGTHKDFYDYGDGFATNCSIDELYLGHAITKIGISAFAGTSLQSLIVGSYYNAWINNVLEDIGEFAFGNCHSLEKVHMIAPLINISGQAFNGNETGSLQEIWVNENDATAKYSSASDDYYYINGIFDNIAKKLVVGCSGTLLNNWSDSITSIGEYSFMRMGFCPNDIKIPDSILEIENLAFSYNGIGGLVDLNNVTNVGYAAFAYNSIKDLDLSQVVSISDYAFANNVYLSSVTLSENPMNVGIGVFLPAGSTTSSINTVIVPNIASMVQSSYDIISSNPILYANCATYGGANLIDLVVPAGITKIGKYSCAGFNTLNVTFEQNSSGTTDIVRIEEGAFNNCKNLTLQVTKTMNYIGADNFSDSSSVDLTCDQPESLAGWKCANRAGSEQYIQYSLLDRAKNNMLDIIYISAVEWTKGEEEVVAYYSNVRENFDHYVQYMPIDHEYNGEECDTTTDTVYIDDYYYEGLFPSVSTDAYVGGIDRFDSKLDRYEPKGLSQSVNDPRVHWICVSYLKGNVLIDESLMTDEEGNVIAGYQTKPDWLNESNIEQTDSYLAIPDKHNGYPVITVGKSSKSNTSYNNHIQSGNKTIQTIYIGNNITEIIGDFNGSDYVKNIVINEKLGSIVNTPWHNFHYLEKIYVNCVNSVDFNSTSICFLGKYNGTKNDGIEVIVGSQVKHLEGRAFYEYNNTSVIKKITFVKNSQLKSIGYRAFYNGRQHTFTEISLPSSLIEIGEDAFYHCDSLINVVFEKDNDGNCKIENIGAQAFGWAINLKQITLPKSIKSLGGVAFIRCANLESVTFEEGINITNLGIRIFEECKNLTTINFANSMTIIGEQMFKNCSVLTELNLPTSLKSIGDEAFYQCNRITAIVVPAGVTEIGKGAFNFTNSTYLTSLSFGDSSGWKYYTSTTDTSGIDAGFTGDPAGDAILMRSYYAGILRKS